MYYGKYGGQFVPEPLVVAMEELDEAYEKYFETKEFQKELAYYFKTFVGRPTAITYLKNISEHLGGAKIYIKREDLTTIGAHKINHSIVQAMLAQRMGKKILIGETGAGMHGTSVATVGAKFGMDVKIFMGAEDIKRQYVNVQRMKMLGAEVIEVNTGTKTLKDAVNEALKYFTNNLSQSYYLLGSALGPYPYPKIVRNSQAIVGKECIEQFPEVAGVQEPDLVVACVGGGSNAIGIFSAYIDNPNVKLIGVEAGGTGIDKIGNHAARFKGEGGDLGVFHGYKSLFLQDEKFNIADTHSISAGLDYPGVGPEHAYLNELQKAEYTYATDDEVMDAFMLTSKMEGILPALESSHALAYAYKIAKDLGKDKTILVNLSGRGDKDLHTVLEVCKDAF